MHKLLFNECRLGGLPLKNRFLRAATWDGMGERDGAFSPAQLELYKTLSRGGAALLTSGYIAVSADGRRNPEQNLLIDRNSQRQLSKIAAVCKNQDCRLMAQLVHCGGQARRSVTGRPLLAPSAIEHPLYEEVPGAFTSAQLQELIEAFAVAAARAREAGCDAVQIHAAHGYLLSQFLSPFVNRREDEFGGSLENRARLLHSCCRRVREKIGDDFIITVKLNGSDYFEEGLTAEESLEIAARLAEEGLDALEISGGSQLSAPLTPVPAGIEAGQSEFPFRDEFNLIEAGLRERKIDLPLIAVGGIRSLETAAELREKGASFISLCRPLIREPQLIRQWQLGREEPATCISCNRCFIPAYKGRGISCQMEK